ncbi:MAG: Na+/H+ antiporter NhaA [Legionellales bacterium]|nr:Na+/H+ antiporter NhaA [Legionellales bacterium]
MVARNVKKFLQMETLGGLLLMFSALLAIVLSNSSFSSWYEYLLNLPVAVEIGDLLVLKKPLVLWVNDGLMAIFFLMVALEIKLEVKHGQLSQMSHWVLPSAAAIGGMALPGLIFVMFNASDPIGLKGWAIPCATDIAFTLGLLGLFGSRVPIGLKMFLMTFAILDDLAAIIVIALFYTSKLSIASMVLSVAFMSLLLIFNLLKVSRISLYAVVGTALWVCVLKSGVHATLAGVIVGFLMPYQVPDPHSPNKSLTLTSQLLHHIHPWVAFFIVPTFAFLNAGVPLGGISIDTLMAPVTAGIMKGLFFGKITGIFSFSFVVVMLGVAHLPTGVKWRHVFAASALGGIGFTMSLFIATLAYSEKALHYMVDARLGIIAGSALSMIAGCLLLYFTLPKPVSHFKT